MFRKNKGRLRAQSADRPSSEWADSTSSVSWNDVSREISSMYVESGGAAVSTEGLGLENDRLGRFHVLSVLGRGGQGTVVLVNDPILGVDRALKLPGLSVLTSSRVSQMIEEARTSVSLSHAHIVTIHEVGQIAGIIDFIVMEYCSGGSLAAWLQRARDETQRRVPWREAAALIAPAASAIAFAHRRGLLHRDLKPGNILLRPKTDVAAHETLADHDAVVSDFGLAIREDASEPGHIADGTRAYMSPERVAGRTHAASRADDIYALGVILYELMTGRRLFGSKCDAALDDAIRKGDWIPIAQTGAMVPPYAAHVVERCLRLDPADRYEDAEALAVDLRALARGEWWEVSKLSGAARTQATLRKYRRAGAVLAACAGIAVAGFVGYHEWHGRRQRSLVDALSTASPSLLPGILVDLDLRHPPTRNAVQAMVGAAQPVVRRNARIALLPDAKHLEASLDAIRGESGRALKSLDDWVARAQERRQVADVLAARDPSTLRVLRAAAQPAVARAGDDTSMQDRRRAAAICLLIAFGDESAWAMLAWSPEPQVRSYAIEALARHGVTAKQLLQKATSLDESPSVRAAVLLALGEFQAESWTESERAHAADAVFGLYRDDADASIHSCAKWLLLRWSRRAGGWPEAARTKVAERLAATDQELGRLAPRDGFRWRIGPGALTLIQLEIPAQGDEPARLIEMSDCEISVAQFHALVSTSRYEPLLSPSLDCPINSVNVEDVYNYCARLDELSQGTAFPTGAEAGGGFRLPTSREFQVAAQSQATSPLYFGRDALLLTRFAWHRDNLQPRVGQPCAGLKPTPGGFFDLIGNLSEWCQAEPPDRVANMALTGAFGCASNEASVMSGKLSFQSTHVKDRIALNSFRVARLITRPGSEHEPE